MCIRAWTVVAAMVALGPLGLSAQAPGSEEAGPWALRLRAVLSGSSDHSDPEGIEVFSGIAIEASLVRYLGRSVAAALSLRSESREVTGPDGLLPDTRWGSLEMAPIDLTLAWFPLGKGSGAWQPYLGAGLNVTPTWEKSGALDSTDEPISLGPVAEFGADWRLAAGTALNLDVRWHRQRVVFEDLTTPSPSVRLDPMALGMGITLRF